MTIQQPIRADGGARHFETERFQTFAAPELAVASPWWPGICFNPACSAPFVLEREWQIYCCPACLNAGRAEMRKYGAKMALSALTWRQFKYAKQGSAEADLARKARSHVTRVQSEWLADRNHRIEGAK